MAGACLNPAADVGLVQGLLLSVDCNVHGLVETGYAALSRPGSQMTLILTAMLTLYVAFLGMRLMLGQGSLRIGDLTLTAVKIGAILALATSWPTYQQVVFDTLFRGPEEIAGSILLAVGSPDSLFGGNPFNGLQLAYNEMQTQAAFFAERSNAISSPFVGGNAFGAFALNISAFIMLMGTLGVILAVKIVLGLLLALGPVFIAMLLFDTTRGLFQGWLRASLACAFAPLFVILALVVQLMLIEPHLVQLAELRALGQVDLAPASAILLLTLITAGVSLAGLIAVAMIAGGLRLPVRQTFANTQESRDRAGQAVTERQTLQARAAANEAQPRAASIAAAAAAMDRRDIRLLTGGQDGQQRMSFAGRVAERPSDQARQPLGSTYRRSAQPRRASSSARRDR